jgi:hypothetical protein
MTDYELRLTRTIGADNVEVRTYNVCMRKYSGICDRESTDNCCFVHSRALFVNERTRRSTSSNSLWTTYFSPLVLNGCSTLGSASAGSTRTIIKMYYATGKQYSRVQPAECYHFVHQHHKAPNTNDDGVYFIVFVRQNPHTITTGGMSTMTVFSLESACRPLAVGSFL